MPWEEIIRKIVKEKKREEKKREEKKKLPKTMLWEYSTGTGGRREFLQTNGNDSVYHFPTSENTVVRWCA